MLAYRTWRLLISRRIPQLHSCELQVHWRILPPASGFRSPATIFASGSLLRLSYFLPECRSIFTDAQLSTGQPSALSPASLLLVDCNYRISTPHSGKMPPPRLSTLTGWALICRFLRETWTFTMAHCKAV